MAVKKLMPLQKRAAMTIMGLRGKRSPSQPVMGEVTM